VHCCESYKCCKLNTVSCIHFLTYSCNIAQQDALRSTRILVKLMGWSKIFRTDAVKIVKLTIRPIGRRALTGPTVSSNFGALPGKPFLSECQAFSEIGPGSPQWYQTGFLSAYKRCWFYVRHTEFLPEVEVSSVIEIQAKEDGSENEDQIEC